MIQAEKYSSTVSKCLKKCDIGRNYGQKKGQVRNRLAAFSQQNVSAYSAAGTTSSA